MGARLITGGNACTVAATSAFPAVCQVALRLPAVLGHGCVMRGGRGGAQAIDLVDEACSNIRVQLDSVPEDIDIMQRRLTALKVPRCRCCL